MLQCYIAVTAAELDSHGLTVHIYNQSNDNIQPQTADIMCNIWNDKSSEHQREFNHYIYTTSTTMQHVCGFKYWNIIL